MSEQSERPTITVERFEEMYEKHQAWVQDHSDGERMVLECVTLPDDIDWYGKSLNEAVFRGVVFKGVNLRNAAFREARFEECEFIECATGLVSFSGANFNYTKFVDCTFRLAHFNQTTFWCCEFVRVIGVTKFVNADMARVTFESCQFGYNTNFDRTTLRDITFRGTPVKGVSFQSAQLFNLEVDSLDGAEFNWAQGDGRYVRTLTLGCYIITYTKDMMFIGCQGFPIEAWKQFTDDEINEMDESALTWWKQYKDAIFTVLDLLPAEQP